MLERDQTFNDIWDRIERLEMQIEDLRDVSRPTDVVILEGEWQSFAGWISDGTVLQDINGQIILDPSEPCILVGADGYIQSQDYVPGVSGWRIDGTGADLIDVEIPTVAPAFTFSTAAAEGAADTFVRSDATLAIFDANNPVQIDAGDAAATGAAGVAARRDHAHAVSSTADGETNASTLLQSDANGYLRLARLGIGIAPTYPLDLYNAGSIVLNVKSNTSQATLYLQGEGTSNSAAINLYDHGSGHFWHVPMRASDHATAAEDLNFYYYNGAYNLYAFFDVSEQAAIFPNIMSIGHTGVWGVLDVRQSTTSGPTIHAYRNLASGSTDSPVLRVVQDNAGDDQAAVYVQQDGSGNVMTLLDSGSKYVSVKSGPELLIGTDTSDSFMTIGLLIDQATNTNEALAIKQDNVAHGVTDYAETDTYATLSMNNGADGGLLIRGYSEQNEGVVIEGYYYQTDISKDTAANATIHLISWRRNGTGRTGTMTANTNLVAIKAGSTTRFIFDYEGDAYADVQWTTYNQHDDVSLLTLLERTLVHDPIKHEFGAWLERGKELLQRLGVVNFYDDGPRAMVNFTRLAMLHTGAIRQLANRVEALEQCAIL
jgi:hypothetical protein